MARKPLRGKNLTFVFNPLQMQADGSFLNDTRQGLGELVGATFQGRWREFEDDSTVRMDNFVAADSQGANAVPIEEDDTVRFVEWNHADGLDVIQRFWRAHNALGSIDRYFSLTWLARDDFNNELFSYTFTGVGENKRTGPYVQGTSSTEVTARRVDTGGPNPLVVMQE